MVLAGNPEAGDIAELEQCWRTAESTIAGKVFAVDLDALTGIDDAGRELLASSEPAGRRLDFLAQEFNREANTLCSKANDAETTRAGLELKAIIDQMREQVQNIE